MGQVSSQLIYFSPLSHDTLKNFITNTWNRKVNHAWDLEEIENVYLFKNLYYIKLTVVWLELKIKNEWKMIIWLCIE